MNKSRSWTVIAYLVSPRSIVLLVALANFVWYFSQSSIVYHWGKESITFCVACAWYWDWSLANPPTLLLFAAVCLFGRWMGSLAALLACIYVVVDGIIWVSRGSGMLRGIASRIEAISENNLLLLWMAPDWQYLLGLVFLATSAVYLHRSLRRISRHN